MEGESECRDVPEARPLDRQRSAQGLRYQRDDEKGCAQKQRNSRGPGDVGPTRDQQSGSGDGGC
jgi:hypothetical protein